MFDEGVKLAGHLDRGMGTAKRLYGALQPLISQIGGQRATKSIENVFQGYDQGRSETMGAYNQVQAQLNRNSQPQRCHALRELVPPATPVISGLNSGLWGHHFA